MMNSVVVIIISRYAFLDFSGIYVFPDHLPKDEYFLRNGPKFRGDDWSLTLEHISNFCCFIDLIRIKHEDVFIILFYDSFQGKCRSWAESLLAKSIRSFSSLLLIFLETWMEKGEYVTKFVSIQGVRKWNKMYTDDEVDEIFSSFFFSYLKSYKGSSEDFFRSTS